MNTKCPRCKFEDGFIVDYDDAGREHTFCSNCGFVLGYGDLRNKAKE